MITAVNVTLELRRPISDLEDFVPGAGSRSTIGKMAASMARRPGSVSNASGVQSGNCRGGH